MNINQELRKLLDEYFRQTGLVVRNISVVWEISRAIGSTQAVVKSVEVIQEDR